jgi:hypothetical protein
VPKGAELVPQPYSAADRAERRESRRRSLSPSNLIASTQNPEIVLAAGVYRGQLVLERPVTLAAAGGPGSVRIVTEHGPAIVARAGAMLRGIVAESADAEIESRGVSKWSEIIAAFDRAGVLRQVDGVSGILNKGPEVGIYPIRFGGEEEMVPDLVSPVRCERVALALAARGSAS